MSDEKPTTQLPAVPPWAIELTTTVKDGFRQVNARLDAVESNLDLQGGSVVDLGKRMTTLEQRVGGVEQRANEGSMRVKAESSTNLQQDAAIASIVTEQAEAKKRDEAIQAEQAEAKKRDGVTQMALAQNTQLTQKGVDTLKAVTSNPALKALAAAAIAFAMAWLAKHT